MTAVLYILLIAIVIANVFLFFSVKRNRSASKNGNDTLPELQEVINLVKNDVKDRKISFLLSAAECGCNTITGFLDNLLTEHFSRNSASVNTILDSRYKNANSL